MSINYNKMHRTGILFTIISKVNLFNKHDIFKSCFTTIICEQILNQSVNRSDCERRRRRHPREAQRSSLYMHNRQQRIKSLKMVVETSNKNQYSYFYILNLFLKLTQPVPTWPDHDVL